MALERQHPSEGLAPQQEGAQRSALDETRAQLRELAGKRFGKLPVAPFVELVLEHTSDADWPVRKAAMEALLRRLTFASRDATAVLAAPRRSVFGTYRVGSSSTQGAGAGRTARGYRTEISSLEPIRTSCDCADFVRGSLGLCKHGLAVLLKLGPSAFVARAPQRTSADKPRMSWRAEAPLVGPTERLARLTLKGPSPIVKKFDGSRPRVDDPPAPAARVRWIERQLAAIAAGQFAAEPAAERVLHEELERAQRLAGNAAQLSRAEVSLGKLRRKLYDYQKIGVRQFLSTGRLLLADDMGLGKTTQAIACCHALVSTGRIGRGLLVVPAALRPQWLREWHETTTVPLIEVLGSPEERAKTYRQTKRGLLLIGYELLLRDLSEVQRFDPELVLLDEAQRIKNWATKSAVAVKSLRAPYRLVLTGTPMENRFDELASLMDFVDDTALEPKWRLVPWHSVSVGNADRGRGGARNLNVLRERLGASFLRRRRAEVLSQLPARTDTRIDVEFTPEQAEEHAAFDQPIAKLVNKANRRPLTQAEFLQLMQLLNSQRLICNGLAQFHFDEEWPRCQATPRPSERFLRQLYAPKLIAFRELVEQIVLGQQRKIVVFSQWRKMLRLAHFCIRDRLEDGKLRAAFFTGAESRKVRERALVDFHDDPAARVLFLSDAGGVGLNLQRAASCLVNLELPWNPAVLEQRIGRVYRLGQTEPVDVLHLVSSGGIESRVAELVARKQAVFSTLFDGTSDEVMFDGKATFLDGIRKLVDPAALSPETSSEASESDEELSQLVSAAVEPSESDPSPASSDRAPGNADSPSHERASPVAGLSIERTPTGGLRIEAPAELAAPLAQVFEMLAASLRAGKPAQSL